MCLRAAQQSYDILLLILMVLLLLQAILTAATVVHCASYKSQLRMGAPEYDDRMQSPAHYYEVRRVKQGLWTQTFNNRRLCLYIMLQVFFHQL